MVDIIAQCIKECDYEAARKVVYLSTLKEDGINKNNEAEQNTAL